MTIHPNVIRTFFRNDRVDKVIALGQDALEPLGEIMCGGQVEFYRQAVRAVAAIGIEQPNERLVVGLLNAGAVAAGTAKKLLASIATYAAPIVFREALAEAAERGSRGLKYELGANQESAILFINETAGRIPLPGAITILMVADCKFPEHEGMEKLSESWNAAFNKLAPGALEEMLGILKNGIPELHVQRRIHGSITDLRSEIEDDAMNRTGAYIRKCVEKGFYSDQDLVRLLRAIYNREICSQEINEDQLILALTQDKNEKWLVIATLMCSRRAQGVELGLTRNLKEARVLLDQFLAGINDPDQARTARELCTRVYRQIHAEVSKGKGRVGLGEELADLPKPPRGRIFRKEVRRACSR